MPPYGVYRAAFEMLALPGVTALLRRKSAARGVIFTLHRVLPEPPADFAPNAILQITPAFLEAVIVRVRQLGFDIVDLDEAVRRLGAKHARPFVVLTFDDAYRDNLHHALPILRKHQAPFTLYVPTALVEGTGLVWWQALEDIIAAADMIRLDEPGQTHDFDAATLEQKNAAFSRIYARYRAMPEPDRERSIRALAARHDFDLAAHCRSLIMDWTELAIFADDPLCTIGAHTVHHFELSKLPEPQMRDEIEQSARVLAERFGKTPAHLSYPIGGVVAAGPREFAAAGQMGFATAVTTRPGGLYPDHLAHLCALPRISLNGLFQENRFVDVLATAEVFTLMRRGRRLDIA